jgi:hypothetical protein
MKIFLTALLIWVSLITVAQATSAQKTENKPQAQKLWERRVTLDARLMPLLYFYSRIREVAGSFAGYGKFPPGIDQATVIFPGLTGELGVAINKQYHIDVMAGFEHGTGTDILTTIPVGVLAHINILQTRFAPCFNFGMGYINWRIGSLAQFNGTFAIAGVGCYARITPYLALMAGPDYRFTYFQDQIDQTDANGNFIQVVKIKNYASQLGFHVSVIFY